MKKINIFNRNTNWVAECKFPFAGEGVPGSTRRGSGGASRQKNTLTPRLFSRTPSRREGEHRNAGLWFAALVALFIATPSFATPTELDKKTVASKAYVDTKQDKITTGNVMFFDDPEGTEGDVYVPGLVAYDSQTNALSGNKIGILDWQTIYDDEGDLALYSNFGGGYGSEMDNFVPTVRAVAEALQNIWRNLPAPLTWNNTQSTAINAYNTTFGDGTNQWAESSEYLIDGNFLANSLALKQNKIPAGTAGNVVTYSGTAGEFGTPLSILTYGQAEEEATLRYGTSFNDEWPAADATKLINGTAFAYGLADKQNKLSAKTSNARAQAVTLSSPDGNTSRAYITAGGSVGLTTRSGAPAVINYVNGTVATTEDMTTFTTETFGSSNATYQNYIKSALVSLELLKDVYAELNSKITNNALPTGTTGTVVTYNGTNANTGVQEFTETAMTGTVTYTNGTLDNANDIATITAVGTRQKKKECGGYEPAAAGQPAHDGTHPGDEDYCWLWIFPED